MKPTLILHARELRPHARTIADSIARRHAHGCYVIARPAANPTLVAHGLVRSSLWHIVTHDLPRRAVADLYVGSKPEAARITRLLANILARGGRPVELELLDNKATPGDLRAHPRSIVAPSSEYAMNARRRGAPKSYLEQRRLKRLAARVSRLKAENLEREASMRRERASGSRVASSRANPKGRIYGPRKASKRTSVWTYGKARTLGRKLRERAQAAHIAGNADLARRLADGAAMLDRGWWAVDATTVEKLRARLAEPLGNPGGPRIVYNKLLGGWYVVVGPHQTPLNGRFNSKAEAQAWLGRRANPSRSKAARIRRAVARGGPGNRKKRRAAAAGHLRKFASLSDRRSERIARRAANPKGRKSTFRFDWKRGTPDSLGRRSFNGWRAATSIGDYYVTPQRAQTHAQMMAGSKDRPAGKLLGYTVQLNSNDVLENGYHWKDIGTFGPHELYKARKAAHDDFLLRVLQGPNGEHAVRRNPKRSNVPALVRELKRIANLYHRSVITHRQLQQFNQRVWDQAKMLGVQNEVLAAISKWQPKGNPKGRNPAKRVIPPGKNLLAEYGSFPPEDRAQVEVIEEAYSPRVRSKVKLVTVSPGWEMAGSMARWTNGYHAVWWWESSGSRHGQQYKEQDFDKARAHFERLMREENSRTRNPKGHDPDLDQAVQRISAGLRRRSGKAWSVTRGRGSVYGWIYIKAPGGRDLTKDEQRELGDLLGFDISVHHQGERIPSGSRARDEYVARAEGRPVRNPKRPICGKLGKAYHDCLHGRKSGCACANPIPRSIDKRSIRTIVRGGAKMLVGCPKGRYSPRAARCKTGMRRVNRRKGGARGVTTRRGRPRARAALSTSRRHPNPASRTERAAQLVRRFEDRGPIKVKTKRMKAPAPLKGAVAKIGDVVAIAYRSKKFDGRSKDYEHKFSSPKPVLVADPDTGDLNIVRGASDYDLTPDGIIN